MAKFPTDRFDRLPSGTVRTGAHRGPRRKGRGWIMLAWAVLATAVIVGAGALALGLLNNTIQLPNIVGGTRSSAAPAVTATPTPTPSVTPVTDPASTVTILNGTATEGLASQVGTEMSDAGWDGVGAATNASSSDVQQTTVYYADAEHEGAALGLAAALYTAATNDAADQGIALSATSFRIELSDQFPGADLTAVIGADFVGPVG